jgi:hypothetical protein
VSLYVGITRLLLWDVFLVVGRILVFMGFPLLFVEERPDQCGEYDQGDEAKYHQRSVNGATPAGGHNQRPGQKGENDDNGRFHGKTGFNVPAAVSTKLLRGARAGSAILRQ